MKKVLSFSLLTGFAASIWGQPYSGFSGADDFVAKERSAHQTVWERVEWQTSRTGRVRSKTNSFVELATGLNFFDADTQQWRSSRAEWLVYADAIVAQSGRHKVILATNLNLGGAVDVLTPDGLRLLSNPIGLGLYDPLDGKHLMLARIKDCQPYWGAATNEIVFRDCFDGVRGSIRYLYTLAGVHQHVILEQRVQLPPGFSDKTRLECYTEFAADTELPQAKSRVLRREKNPTLRAQMVEPDFTDNELAWGTEMKMRAGTAFALGEESPDRSVRVGKQVQMIGGRPVLIEAVEFKAVESMLSKLTASVEKPKSSSLAIHSSRQLPHAEQSARIHERFQSAPGGKEIQLAGNPLRDPALVIDYELLGGDTDFIFKGDTTYYVTNQVTLDETTTIEGGAVIKCSESANSLIYIAGTVVCNTDAYRPAIFTSKNDNSVGQILPSSSGTPAKGTSTYLDASYPPLLLKHLRFSYAGTAISAIYLFEPDAGELWDIQFSKCDVAINGLASDFYLYNVLFYDCSLLFSGGYSLRGEHVTVNRCDTFVDGADFYLTNSILANVTNLNSWPFAIMTGSHNVFQQSDIFGYSAYLATNAVFQTIGAGAHYLADNAYRDAGTTNVNAELLASLKQKTTYSPLVLSNVSFAANTNLVPRMLADTNALDLGFHYPILDWALNSVTVANNVSVVLTNGVNVATFGQSGLALRVSSKLISEGTPTQLNRLVGYHAVQEQSVIFGGNALRDYISAESYTYANSEIHLRFTDLPVMSGNYHPIYCGVPGDSVLQIKDCQLWGGKLSYDMSDSGGMTAVIHFTNNLLWRVDTYFRAAASSSFVMNLRNNLFKAGRLTFEDDVAVQIHDNLFDALDLSFGGTEHVLSHNGYLNTSGGDTNSGDVILSSLAYQTGPLGDFYQPTSSTLINRGSSDAYSAGLYHHTTTANQVKEINSIVDIGFHYVIVVNGAPLDADSDGTPDYDDADSDGDDGLPDWWEQRYFGKLTETPSGDYDGDCVTNLLEYLQVSNPVDPPYITVPFIYQVVPTNANVTFSVGAGPSCVNYQWYKSGAAISGSTASELTMTGVQLTDNGIYRVDVFSSVGSVSTSARLVVLDSPAWTIWTNYLAHTNSKSINLRATPQPPFSYSGSQTPTFIWNTNCLLYGKTGFTALSPFNSWGGTDSGVTALTRRHGYMRGHGVGAHYFSAAQYPFGFKDETVWFYTADNQLVQMTVAGSFNRNRVDHPNDDTEDYTILIFTEDLTNSITPLSVMIPPNSVGVLFSTSQFGYMSANMNFPAPFNFFDASRPPFNERSTSIGGDSGRPDMIPMPDGSLVFVKGRSTSSPSDLMQADMDELCTNATLNLNLEINSYQLNWRSYP